MILCSGTLDPLNQMQQDKALIHRRHAYMRMNILLLNSYSHNNVSHEPQRHASTSVHSYEHLSWFLKLVIIYYYNEYGCQICTYLWNKSHLLPPLKSRHNSTVIYSVKYIYHSVQLRSVP